MSVIKAAAGLPEYLLGLTRRSMTVAVLLVVSLLGVAAWFALDTYYQQAIQQTLSSQWQETLRTEVNAERTRLRKALTAFSDTAVHLAQHPRLLERVQGWNRHGTPHSDIEFSEWKPDWLSRNTTLDGNLPVEYAIVTGSGDRVRAIYADGQAKLPRSLINIQSAPVQALLGQYRVRVIDQVPYLFSAAAIAGRNGQTAGNLVVATRVSRQLLASVRQSLSLPVISGLLLGKTRQVVTLSSDAFESFEQLRPFSDELLLDAGDEYSLRHVTWIDERQLRDIGRPLLLAAREQRALAIAAFIALLLGFLCWSRGRIKHVNQLVAQYSSRLGISVPDYSHGDQVHRLRHGLQRMAEEVIAETYVLEYQAQHDSLTSLPNRTLMLERLEDALSGASSAEPLALFVMDLDQFKEVNDTLGHHVGDRLLQEVGRRLASVLRRTDVVARLGGDEFAVLLPGADYERSKSVCRKILAAMKRPIKVDTYRLRAGISIGVALCPEHGKDSSLLFQHADVAMYTAKRNQLGFSFYSAEQDEHSISRLGLSASLQEAIEQDQLILDYQPMVDIGSGQIFCVEALVRWCHPEYGLIAPDEFISTAEQTGVIRPLTLWVIEQAVAQIAAWTQEGIDLCVSVNLSVRCLQDRKLPVRVEALLDKYQINPARVSLEITESAIMSDPLTARRVMRRLSTMGFQLSIDDFGTGYSSLAYLKQLPVDGIKIDKSFVGQMDRDENDAVIVRATIDLAHNLGLKVVAEGVESNDVWDLLEMLGCDTAQGYFIRKPLSALELTAWIRSRDWEQERWVHPLGMAN